jgi:HlyD family secretion protein
MALDEQHHRRATRNPRFWIFLIAVALVVILLAAFVSRRRGEIFIRADQVSIQDLENKISTNGKVEPTDNFEAHSPAPTTVKKIFEHEGQWVKAGTLLLQLDDADARAQAARALAQLRAAEADIHVTKTGGTQEELLSNESQLAKAQTERDAAQRNLQALEKLQQTGAAAPGEVQEARNRLTRAESDLKLLQQKQTQRFSRPEVEKVHAAAEEARASYAAAQDLLHNANVRAPRDGMVYSIPVREGEFVQQGELLLQVANLKNVQVRAFVDEPEIGRLSVNQPVTITWDALPGKSWSGKIAQVPLTVTTRGTRNVGEVVVQVDNSSDARLLPNTNVTVAITLARDNHVITIAREAIHMDSKGRYVYVIEDGRLKRQNVDTSISSLTRIEITKGLQAGQTIALGAYNGQALREGMPVKTTP